MHDTVRRVRKLVRSGSPQTEVSLIVSRRLQDAGLARALAEPFSAHFESAYLGSFRWLGIAERFATQDGDDQAAAAEELVFTSRHLGRVLDDLVPFLERVEENLEDREEITHREAPYEREVAPFSRLDSTQEFREALAAAGLDADAAGQGAQTQADLLKIVYLEHRLRKEAPRIPDLYAMVVELGLDVRRHLRPALDTTSPFLVGVAARGRS